jgi:hypothetical protein
MLKLYKSKDFSEMIPKEMHKALALLGRFEWMRIEVAYTPEGKPRLDLEDIGDTTVFSQKTLGDEYGKDHDYCGFDEWRFHACCTGNIFFCIFHKGISQESRP